MAERSVERPRTFMMQVKLTKGELKRQRDALKQYRRYLPMLQLKKQQLQMEIFQQHARLKERQTLEQARYKSISLWAGLIAEWIEPVQAQLSRRNTLAGAKNIAGVDIPVFEKVVFEPAEYDLYHAPLWVDHALDAFESLIGLREEITLIEASVRILKHELQVTTQRVNLFEKVKIPEAEEAVRRIKIFIGDQLANAVGRSKIAKRKIQVYAGEEGLA